MAALPPVAYWRAPASAAHPDLHQAL